MKQKNIKDEMLPEYDLNKLSSKPNPYYDKLVNTVEISQDNFQFYSKIAKAHNQDIQFLINELLTKDRSIIELAK